MVERNTDPKPDRFKSRKPVQVVFTPQEFEMVRRIADTQKISVPVAIRRAIHLQEWVRRLQDESSDNLILGVRNSKGEIKTAIPVRLIPIF